MNGTTAVTITKGVHGRVRAAPKARERLREVSGSAVGLLLDLAAKKGLELDALTAGLEIEPKQGGKRGRRYTWVEYTTILERLAERVGLPELERMAEGMPEVLPELRALASAFVSPGTLYRFVLQVIDPSVYPMVRMELREVSEDVLELKAELRDGYRGSLAYFRASLGGLRTLPRYLDLPDAQVTGEVGPQHGIYRIELPGSRTLAARLKQRARTASRQVFWKEALRQIEADKGELVEHLLHLQRITDDLEHKNHALERELENRARLEDALKRVLSGAACAAFLVDEGQVEPANDVAAFALRQEGGELRHRIAATLNGGPADPELEVSPLNREGGFLVMRRGATDLIEQRLDLATESWSLTRRQRDVLRGLVNGRGNKEIARDLACTVKTVEAHVTALLERADAESRLSVVAAFWSDL